MTRSCATRVLSAYLLSHSKKSISQCYQPSVCATAVWSWHTRHWGLSCRRDNLVEALLSVCWLPSSSLVTGKPQRITVALSVSYELISWIMNWYIFSHTFKMPVICADPEPSHRHRWKPRVVTVPTVLSVMVPQVVVMTIWGATSEDKDCIQLSF